MEEKNQNEIEENFKDSIQNLASRVYALEKRQIESDEKQDFRHSEIMNALHGIVDSLKNSNIEEEAAEPGQSAQRRRKKPKVVGEEKTIGVGGAELKEEKKIRIGAEFQAELPGPQFLKDEQNMVGLNFEAESKWLGYLVWTGESEADVEDKNEIVCHCPNAGDIECIRFHLSAKRAFLVEELSGAYGDMRMGECGMLVADLWSQEDMKTFKNTVKRSKRDFWDKLFAKFPQKTTAELVRFYFNVYLMEGMSNMQMESDGGESQVKCIKRDIFGLRGNAAKKPEPEPLLRSRSERIIKKKQY